MKTTSQAREDIWVAIKNFTTADDSGAEVKGPTALHRVSGLSLSMLYKFKGGSRLGPDGVMALKPHLKEVDDATWLAAMGVEHGPAEASP